MRHILAIASIAAALSASPAVAQSGAPQTRPATSTMAPKPGTKTMERTSLSKDCSAQADQKGLHGKARKRFRSACKRGKS